MNRIINRLCASFGGIHYWLAKRLVEIITAPKQNVDSILTILFYCAVFGAVLGTTVVRCQPTLNGIWCIIAIAGASYGFLLACLSVLWGMAIWCCIDLVGGARTHLRTINCVYGGGFVFAVAVNYWVILPLLGTAISIIAIATILPLIVFGYCHDRRTAKIF